MPQLLLIELDKHVAYAPGETVTGRVFVNLSNFTNIKEIRLEATGKAKVSFTRSRTVHHYDGHSHQETDFYEEQISYLKIYQRLVGTGIDGRLTTLPAGQHSYPFYFKLPENIPSSFEHKYGHIRYSVKAIFDQPWRFNRTADAEIKVFVPWNFNPLPRRLHPINDELDHLFFFCCFFCYADVMTVNVNSGTSVFTGGSAVELIVNYDNHSKGVNITKMQLALVQNMKFSAHNDSRTDSKILRRIHQSGPFSKKGETLLKIILPSESPQNPCSIIQFDYKLVLTIHVSSWHRKITRSYGIGL